MVFSISTIFKASVLNWECGILESIFNCSLQHAIEWAAASLMPA